MSTRTSHDAFRLLGDEPDPREQVDTTGLRFKCTTDASPQASLEAVLDATEGFVPLWVKGTVLRWRFHPDSLARFEYPDAVRKEVRQLMNAGMEAWGSAAPITLDERNDNWDFEVIVRKGDDCDKDGCTVAQAFFPDGGRHQLLLFPLLFKQDPAEQLATIAHELGHVYGLRHFFADLSEQDSPSVIYGTHDPFTIMNYGARSVLTEADKSDLARLYEAAWAGKLKQVKGTPIRFFQPYHASGVAA